MTRCPRTGKVRHRDKLAAQIALSSTERSRATKRLQKPDHERTVYRCRFCRGWHLSSEPPEGAAA